MIDTPPRGAGGPFEDDRCGEDAYDAWLSPSPCRCCRSLAGGLPPPTASSGGTATGEEGCGGEVDDDCVVACMAQRKPCAHRYRTPSAMYLAAQPGSASLSSSCAGGLQGGVRIAATAMDEAAGADRRRRRRRAARVRMAHKSALLKCGSISWCDPGVSLLLAERCGQLLDRDDGPDCWRSRLVGRSCSRCR